MRQLFLLLLLLTPFALAASAQDLPSIAEHTADMDVHDGYFPIYWDAAEGKLFLEVPRLNEEFLYVVSLPAGLGSNDIGLDRGQLGPQRIVRFERVGRKMLLVAPNLDYRATTENEAERRSVRDAFAEGVVWGFEAVAATGERVLVNATDFLMRDAHGVISRLQSSGEGSFRLDASRSALHLDMTRAFPRNTEMEARMTFVSDNPGRQVHSVAADPNAVTLRVRHSFVALPEPGYEPRRLDPRSGYFGVNYADYSAPIGEEMTQRFIARHRLEKRDPHAAVSEPVEPIVYYLDPGTPEPVRSALLDGARWWNDAFEAAGYRDAFRVEMLPEDADPMDVRYNVIQWVHRSTRGWSYGSSVVDPRTGEIIKGHVTLGSLRVRQDYLLAEGLLMPYVGEHAAGLPAADDPMLEMALARLRQLSAHEVGHTLGIAHNFAASTNGRESVMDYPAPLVTVDADGTLSLDDAYAEGVGAWDVVAVRYGYTDFPDGADEVAELAAILDEAHARGLHYITDSDARPAGAAHPYAHLWDNGADVVQSFRDEMEVRRIALERFGEAAIRTGRPMATLEEVLVPLYLRHRYQVDATSKLLGGVIYDYTLRGDGRPAPEPVPAETQRAAIEVLLASTDPDVLRLPESVVALIPPRPTSYSSHRELFDRSTGLTFDPYSPAETAVTLVFNQLLQADRASRMASQKDLDESMPGFADLLTVVTDRIWRRTPRRSGRDAELERISQRAWTDALMRFAARDDLAPRVRAATVHHVDELAGWLNANPGAEVDPETTAHRYLVKRDLRQMLDRPYDPVERQREVTVPPGSPIGGE